MMKFKVWLLTPDYPPQLGGLSTFSVTIEETLKKIGISYKLVVWQQIRDTIKLKIKNNDLVLNIHFVGGLLIKNKKARVINFIHGSEVLFYSPCWYKRLFKRVFKKRLIRHLESAYLNIFISESTQELLMDKGFRVNYGRDIILHNCQKFPSYPFEFERSIEDVIKFCCIVRDVPHKNIDGVIELAEHIAKISNLKVELYVTSSRDFKSQHIKVIDISGIPDAHREQVYRDSHFNVLLSQDHSKKGYIEGFGLTVLEAGKFGVPSLVSSHGGLPESVHHGETGWVIDRVDLQKWWNDLTSKEYQRISKNCYEHTRMSHDSILYKKLLSQVIRDE